MDKKNEEKGPAEGFRMFQYILPHLPSLMLRLTGSFLKLKRKAKKGGKEFHKELIKQGIDETTAMQLTEIYLKPSNIKQYFNIFFNN